MTEQKQIYKCNICSNIVEVLHAGIKRSSILKKQIIPKFMAKKYLIFSILVSFVLLSAGFTAFAEQTTSARMNKIVDISCAQSAVNKRETAVQSAFSAWNSSISSALQTRASELASAWQLTDKTQRQNAIRSAWEKFKTSKKVATETFRKAKQAAWKQYKTDLKNCKIAQPIGENEGADISL